MPTWTIDGFMQGRLSFDVQHIVREFCCTVRVPCKHVPIPPHGTTGDEPSGAGCIRGSESVTSVCAIPATSDQSNLGSTPTNITPYSRADAAHRLHFIFISISISPPIRNRAIPFEPFELPDSVPAMAPLAFSRSGLLHQRACSYTY